MAGAFAIPITKAKKNLPVSEDIVRGFDEDIYNAIFAEGLKAYLNKGMTGDKFRTTDLEGEELAEVQEAIFEKAKANLQSLIDGNLKRKKSKPKVPREVLAMARHDCIAAIKAAMKKAGKKIAGIKGSVFTAQADEMIAEDPEWLERAEIKVAKAKAEEAIIVEPKAGSKLEALIASAETAKPKVPPKRKEKATAETVVAAKATAKGKGKGATAH